MNVTGTIPDGRHQHGIHKGGDVSLIPRDVNLLNVFNLHFSFVG